MSDLKRVIEIKAAIVDGFEKLQNPKKKQRRAWRPNEQCFDKVVIETIPRYKTSDASGDEWRYHVRTTLFKKGIACVTDDNGNVENAVRGLDHFFRKSRGKGHGEVFDDLCDQESCPNVATHTYKIKKEFCRCGCGHESDPYEFFKTPLVRKFCVRHSTRGNCALDDADRNYELLEGGEPQKCNKEDISKSAFGGIIVMEVPE